MTYEKIKKSIETALHKAMTGNASDTQNVAHQVMLNIDSRANTWNHAAIELSEENTKIPSRRQKVIRYPDVTTKVMPGGAKMSTNEWNSLALLLRDKYR